MQVRNLEQAIQELVSIDDVIRWSVTQLNQSDVYYGHGTDNPIDEARALLSHVLQLTSAQLADMGHCRLLASEKQEFTELLKQRIEKHIPSAYLTHQAWFAGLPFYVDERVLVPRSPIAELIENGFQPWLTQQPHRVLDLCTGGGCIAIACAYAFPEAEVDALDISTEALEVAEFNIEQHGLTHQVTPIQSDLFNAVKAEKYDLIVSNPPYVDSEDMADLPPEYLHEPELGLAAGEDGLILVDDMLLQAPDLLNDGGLFVCEVGNSMLALAEKYPQTPFTWLEFANGGDGVFLLTKEQLIEHKQRETKAS
ncbi:50S ribosomal protein L3 N(5)-glutamine methyltransferase [Idiomarina ramblicola]|uniref:Ribosomal protein uL3 glutamine methyltransferase n=1 Tax=Idiomarina ramblicola TaxID=263724 RepID=A0A432YYZ1_9GAMM|nr:50S ribosomal protein L3 N(5)-glutamine methyltransferase [Idiomarina ramblicola]RUO68848.1 50S ribosomal protein L3 N(5)-glutamine methyltransferase [Idiomarina ramblicola]